MTRYLLFVVLACSLAGCSVRSLVLERVGDAVANGGTTFSSDDDPELVRAAAPFSLKLIESLLEEAPAHRGLLLAAARGFTQYAYAFVQQEADAAEDHDIARALSLRSRARGLYRRARDYGLRGLGVARPGLVRDLYKTPAQALAGLSGEDVALLYWTGVSWAALIGLSLDSPEALADLPLVEATMDRALALDEAFDRGAIHTFMIGFESVRQGAEGDAAERARRHFERVMELSGGADAAPLVAYAEAVSVPKRRRAEFETLLGRALQIDTTENAANRLANIVAQRRALWLLSRAPDLFID